MPDVIKCGLRVVRGVDWEWDDQDGGEGYVGTVTQVGGQGNSKIPNETVAVVWDSGARGNYRTGYKGKYDLRVFDNASAGESFPLLCSSFYHYFYTENLIDTFR